MADVIKPGARPAKAAAGPTAPKSRLDLATLGGLVTACCGIVGGLLLERGEVADISQGTAALIVLGGTIGAVLVSTPLPIAIKGFRALRHVLFTSASSTRELVETLIRLA